LTSLTVRVSEVSFWQWRNTLGELRKREVVLKPAQRHADESNLGKKILL